MDLINFNKLNIKKTNNKVKIDELKYNSDSLWADIKKEWDKLKCHKSIPNFKADCKSYVDKYNSYLETL